MNRGRIALVGFMGCGKSTIGRELARRLGSPLVDLDGEIVRQQGMSIPEIFAVHGQAHFRQLEHQALLQLPQRRVVLSCGGGLATFRHNVAVLKKHYCTVFLDCPFEVCYQRIAHSPRPLVKENTKEQLYQLYLQRQHLYEHCCNLQISADHSPFVVAGQILKALRKK